MRAQVVIPVIASTLILVSTLFINQAFALPLDNEWQIREQEITTLQTVGCTFVTDSTRILIQMFPDKTKVGFCHMFKVFDKADIQNKILNVTWNQDLDFFTFSRISVFDGAYDRNNATQFPLDPIAFTFSGFTRALPEGLQGGGQLHTVFRTDRFNPTTDPPDSINMTLAGSTLPQVTIAITFRDGSTSTRFAGGIDEIKIIDFAKWDWDSSSSVTMAVTGTQNDIGVTNANLTDLINGSLKITKNVTSGNAVFNFTVTNSTFTQPLSINTTATNMTAPITLTPGFYDVTETVPLNWDLINASCGVVGESFTNPTISNVSINVSDEIECIFENSLDENAIEKQQEAIEESNMAIEEACTTIEGIILSLISLVIPIPQEIQDLVDLHCT